MLAHNVLYTYIEPLAVEAGPWLDRLLLAFGLAAIAGIGIAGWGGSPPAHAGVGAVIGFIVPVLALLLWPGDAIALLLATILWALPLARYLRCSRPHWRGVPVPPQIWRSRCW